MRVNFTLKERDYIISEDFPWYLGIHTSDPKHITTIQLPNTKEVPMLTHQIYNRGEETSTMAPSILEQLKEVTNYKKILRVKLQTKVARISNNRLDKRYGDTPYREYWYIL